MCMVLIPGHCVVLCCRLHEIMQSAEDMAINIPNIWEYLGELVGPLMEDGKVPLHHLRDLCQPLMASNCAGTVAAKVLHEIAHRQAGGGCSTLREQYNY